MTTITDGTQTTTPLLWMEYESISPAKTIEHELIGGGVVVTVAPHSARRVNLALLYDDEAASAACEAMHKKPAIWTITEPGRDTHSMQYVVVGDVSRKLDTETARMWIVSAEVREAGAQA